MKTLFSILAIVAILFAAGCTDKNEPLTEANMSELKVPQNFDYEMSRMVEINLVGAHRLPVTIMTTDGKVLYRGMMQPESGLQTKFQMANAFTRVVLVYHVHEVTVNVRNNRIEYNFSSN